MAIQDDETGDREIWTSVSQHWYSKASDEAPTQGSSYHHLAILARSKRLQQLFYHIKSLCVPIPFDSAPESVETLFDHNFSPTNTPSYLIQIEDSFVKAHGILFRGKCANKFSSTLEDFLNNLNDNIGKTTRR